MTSSGYTYSDGLIGFYEPPSPAYIYYIILLNNLKVSLCSLKKKKVSLECYD